MPKTKPLLIASLLIFIGFWFLKLWYFGQLDFYILPRFNFLVILSGGMLMIFGAVMLSNRSHHWDHAAFHTQMKSLIPFVGLIALALLAEPVPLSSQSVAQRGVETDLSQIRLTTPINFAIDSQKRTFADWIKILGTSKDNTQYEGETAIVQGFVYRDENLNPNEFYLSRFLIRCCSADARPVVMKVRTESAGTFENDQWIEAQGVMRTSEGDPFIELEEFNSIPTPERPYIY